MALDTAYWTVCNHIVIWGSALFYLLLAIVVYEGLFLAFPEYISNGGVAFSAISTAPFWLSIYLSVVFLILPVVRRIFVDICNVVDFLFDFDITSY